MKIAKFIFNLLFGKPNKTDDDPLDQTQFELLSYEQELTNCIEYSKKHQQGEGDPLL